MTNDKLKRLREWVQRTRVRGRRQLRLSTLTKIDRMLAEPKQEPAQDAEIAAFISATANIDWRQHLLNRGGCFHVESGRLCGRAIKWAGHRDGDDYHVFVPLHVAVTRVARRVAEAGAAAEELAQAVEAGLAKADADTEPYTQSPEDKALEQRLRIALAAYRKAKDGAA